VIGFFNAYRDGERVTRNRLRDIAQQFQGELRVAGEERGGAHGVRRRICANPKPPRVRGSCVRISSESSSPVDAIAGLTLFLDLRLSAAFGLPATRAI
jgi:hypothetical protein